MGPDRVIGFSPIPAMSMVSYAAGSRYLSLLGGLHVLLRLVLRPAAGLAR
jgi:nitrate reductase alpha subunit